MPEFNHFRGSGFNIRRSFIVVKGRVGRWRRRKN